MRLDTSYLAYLTKDELRVLVAVEMGMKNHEYVPASLIEKISKVKRANAYQILQNLLKNKLLQHVSKQYDGYRLTYLGYDFLALSAFYKRGSVTQVIQKVGVGKESDIYQCLNADGHHVILKLARLGRTSFRTVKKNRDYLQNRTQFNWLYLSRLASIKEFAFMEICHKNQFPTPKPIDWNRHAIVMSMVDGFTLCSVQELGDTEGVFKQCVDLIERFAQHGLIHSDFNEFNLMITEQQKIIVIDFPQMVSTQHLNAEFYFHRDLDCINTFFFRRFKFNQEAQLNLKDIEIIKNLDIEVKASGFIKQQLKKNQELDLLDEYNQIKQEDKDIQNEEEEEDQDDEEDGLKIKKQQSQKQQQEESDSDDDVSDEEDSESEIKNQDNEEEQQKQQQQKPKPQKLSVIQQQEQQLEQSPEQEEQSPEQEEQSPEQQEEAPESPQIEESPVQQHNHKQYKLGQFDQEYIKKIVKNKYRTKQVIKKNINKNKEINFEERVADVYL